MADPVTITFAKDQIIKMVEEGLGIDIHPPCLPFGIYRDGELIGGVVFNEYNGANIEVTVYAPVGMKRNCIRQVMHYVFKDLKCTRLSARTKKSNAPVRKMLIKLGFVYEGTMHHYYGAGAGDGALFYRLDPENAERWLS